MATWDFASFIIGGLTFTILLIVILWILYSTHTFIFAYCATEPPVCGSSDFISNPGDAIANGYHTDDLLAVNSDGELIYRRPVKTSGCTPMGAQDIQVYYPQYCSFERSNGSHVEGRLIPNTTKYSVIGQLDNILAQRNCIPIPQAGYINGRPIAKWDPANITN